MSELERAQEAAKAAFDPRPSPLRSIVTPEPVSLTDQWTKLETIELELRKRIRRERLAISAAYDKQVVEINQETDRKIEEAMLTLESERRSLLQALASVTAEKLREHELLAKRMGSGL